MTITVYLNIGHTKDFDSNVKNLKTILNKYQIIDTTKSLKELILDTEGTEGVEGTRDGILYLRDDTIGHIEPQKLYNLLENPPNDVMLLHSWGNNCQYLSNINTTERGIKYFSMNNKKMDINRSHAVFLTNKGKSLAYDTTGTVGAVAFIPNLFDIDPSLITNNSDFDKVNLCAENNITTENTTTGWTIFLFIFALLLLFFVMIFIVMQVLNRR